MFSLDRVSVGDKITAENWNKIVDAVNELNETVRRQRIAPSDDFILTEDFGGTTLELRGRASDGDGGEVYVPPFKVTATLKDGKLTAKIAKGTVWHGSGTGPAHFREIKADSVEKGDLAAGEYDVCLTVTSYLNNDRVYTDASSDDLDELEDDEDTAEVVKNLINVLFNSIQALYEHIEAEDPQDFSFEIIPYNEFKSIDDWSWNDEQVTHHYLLARVVLKEDEDSGALSVSKVTQVLGGDIWHDTTILKATTGTELRKRET